MVKTHSDDNGFKNLKDTGNSKVISDYNNFPIRKVDEARLNYLKDNILKDLKNQYLPSTNCFYSTISKVLKVKYRF